MLIPRLCSSLSGMDIVIELTAGISASKQLHAIYPVLKILIVTNHDGAELREAVPRPRVSAVRCSRITCSN